MEWSVRANDKEFEMREESDGRTKAGGGRVACQQAGAVRVSPRHLGFWVGGPCCRCLWPEGRPPYLYRGVAD